MIAARKQAWFNFVLRRWLGRIIRRRFHNVYIAGAEHLRGLDPARPVVGCVNHTNWWDGLVLYVLSHRLLPHDIHLAMEEKNLRRYPFFRWMGAFGIDLTHPRAALPGLRHALRLLGAGAGRLVWIFTPGRLCDAGLPVEVRPGALFLARRTAAQVLPLVIRYEWLIESRPSILIHVAAPIAAHSTPEALAAALDRLVADATAAARMLDLSGYEPLFTGGVSMNKRWDIFVHRLLCRPGPVEKQNR